MALKVELRPGERIILGQSIITNDNQRTRLYIEGNAPLLREKSILTPETANTPAKKVYLAVQLMYLADDITVTKEEYFTLVGEILAAAPSCLPIIENINNWILTEQLYKALKEAQNLINYEEELIRHATSGGAGIWTDGSGNNEPEGSGSNASDESSGEVSDHS